MSFETVMQPYNSSDPSASFVASSALDFLLIELVPLAYRVTTEASASEQGEEPEDYDATAEKTTKTTADTAAAATVTSPTSFGRMDEDEALDAVQHKLESTGYRVGQGLVERCVAESLGIPRALRSLSPAASSWLTFDTWQILERPPSIQRQPRCHQVSLQGLLVAGLWKEYR